MNFSKFLTIPVAFFIAVTCVQCNCKKESVTNQEMKLSEASFTNETIYFNSYTAGTKEGGTGYELHFENFDVPENVELNKVYFADQTGKIYKTLIGYSARTKVMSSNSEDVIMSSDVNKEASNTAPVSYEKFPFAMKEGSVGVQYTKDGKFMYTIMDNVLQREPIYYPSAPPKEQKQ